MRAYYGEDPLNPDPQLLNSLGVGDFRLDQFEERIWRLYELTTALSDPFPILTQRTEGDKVFQVIRFLPSLSRLEYACSIFQDEWEMTPEEFIMLIKVISWMRDYERKVLLEKK